jgi:hypothetical protein
VIGVARTTRRRSTAGCLGVRGVDRVLGRRARRAQRHPHAGALPRERRGHSRATWSAGRARVAAARGHRDRRAAPVLRPSGLGLVAARRRLLSGGELVWLEADATIRQKTADEVARRLRARVPRRPRRQARGQDVHVRRRRRRADRPCAPNDWAGFLRARIVDVQPKAPIAASRRPAGVSSTAPRSRSSCVPRRRSRRSTTSSTPLGIS